MPTSSTYKVVCGSTIYLVDSAKDDGGLKASIRVGREETTAQGAPIFRTVHQDRINLDQAKARQKFADEAGTDAADLLEVCSRLRDYLTPASSSAEEPSEPADADVIAQAMALLEDPQLLTRLGEEVIRASGYAGDLKHPRLLYLVMTSRLTRRPVNVLIAGPSSAGKSYLMESTADCFPPSATYVIGAMSEKALVYTDADFEHRHLLISEAAAIQHDGVGALIVRSVIWGNCLEYEITEQDPDGIWRTRRISKPGPTGLITTSVKGIEPELETRMLTMTVPDDEQTTRDILTARSERAAGSRPDAIDLRPWHEAQRWLAEEGVHDVVIPFATTLGRLFPAKLVRARRDFEQLLTLIEACALLHQQQRDRDAQDRIIAAEADYRLVYELASSIFGAAAAEGVTPAVRETVAKVAELTRAADDNVVSAHAVAAALNLGKAAVSRRVGLALKGGFLVNEEPIRGKPYKLRVGEPLPEEANLPAPDRVFPLSSPESMRTVEHHPENPHNGAEMTVRMGRSNTRTVRFEHPDRSHGGIEHQFPHNGGETQELFECSNGFREGETALRETVSVANSPAPSTWWSNSDGSEEGIL